jgi:hypothetical protein
MLPSWVSSWCYQQILDKTGKWLPGTNTQAYLESSVMKETSFITLTPDQRRDYGSRSSDASTSCCRCRPRPRRRRRCLCRSGVKVIHLFFLLLCRKLAVTGEVWKYLRHHYLTDFLLNFLMNFEHSIPGNGCASDCRTDRQPNLKLQLLYCVYYILNPQQ